MINRQVINLLNIVILIVVCCCCSVVHAEQEYYFKQQLDHYNPQEQRTFQQRYFIFDKYYNGGNNILLYICGEATCPGTPTNYAQEYARLNNALLVTVEHRYYGKSVPQMFTDLSTENLKYLSSEQALADLANFISTYKSPYKGYKWIAIGCSYPGALSAWLRLKYPHLVAGSLSSSGVVNTIIDFIQFDQQVYESAGFKCGTVLQRVTKALENKVLSSSPAVADATKKLFNCASDMTSEDFFFLMADAAAESIQYGFHGDVCDRLEPLYDSQPSDEILIATYAEFVKNSYYKNFGEDSPLTYTTKFAQNTSLALVDAGVRQWTYQFCSELGYLQNAPPTNSIRSSVINMDYWAKRCKAIYGFYNLKYPSWADIYYGQGTVAIDKIVFANGSQDPWQRAGITYNKTDDRQFLVTCENCGHCVDLRGCPSLPSGSVSEHCVAPGDQAAKQLRDLITMRFKRWFQDE